MSICVNQPKTVFRKIIFATALRTPAYEIRSFRKTQKSGVFQVQISNTSLGRKNAHWAPYRPKKIENFRNSKIIKLPIFWFLTKINIFDVNLEFYISIFSENFGFWWKFRVLRKIASFGENFEFSQKIRVLTIISIFDENFAFWQKIRFLT